MQPNEPAEAAFREGPPPVKPKPALKSATLRYAAALVLLVLIVAGIAWVVQYLPGRGKKVPPPPPTEDYLLGFPRPIADWRQKIDPKAKQKDFDKDNIDPDMIEMIKFAEPGSDGHYDFLFKCDSKGEVDLVEVHASCDCASVKACLLPADELERLNNEQMSHPGVPLPYAKEPNWVAVPKDTDKGTKGEGLRIKPGEGGALRITWHTKDAPGSDLRLGVRVLIQPPHDREHRRFVDLLVPAKIVPPLLTTESRLVVGPLTSGKSAKASFYIWSATRNSLEPTIYADPPDPLFQFTIKQLSKEDAAGLQRSLQTKQIPARILCAYSVEVTVHENKDGKFLDQGVFYRKFPFAIEGKFDANAPLWGPEIVGKVIGNIQVGGEDDKGRIRFEPFSAREEAIKEVYLSTDPNMELATVERHPDQPSYLKIELTRGEKGSERASWNLKVTVPPGKASPGAFEERHAVVLRIGNTGQFLRIPLEANISK
jgi:hypothetical protein